MAVSTIRHEEPLETMWQELVYTEARLLADKRAKDLAPPIKQHLVRWEQARHGQVEAWRGEVVAQAHVDAADDGMDDFVTDFARSLLDQTKGDRGAPLFRRYFNHAPNKMIRVALGSELPKVRPWVKSLSAEKDARLKAHGEALSPLVADGEAALKEREDAAASRADQRAREIAAFVDDVNAARLSLYGVLIGRVEKLGVRRDWPDRFFRHATRTAPEPPPPPTTPAK